MATSNPSNDYPDSRRSAAKRSLGSRLTDAHQQLRCDSASVPLPNGLNPAGAAEPLVTAAGDDRGEYAPPTVLVRQPPMERLTVAHDLRTVKSADSAYQAERHTTPVGAILRRFSLVMPLVAVATFAEMPAEASHSVVGGRGVSERRSGRCLQCRGSRRRRR